MHTKKVLYLLTNERFKPNKRILRWLLAQVWLDSNHILVLLIVCHWSYVINNPWRSEDPWPGSFKRRVGSALWRSGQPGPGRLKDSIPSSRGQAGAPLLQPHRITSQNSLSSLLTPRPGWGWKSIFNLSAPAQPAPPRMRAPTRRLKGRGRRPGGGLAADGGETSKPASSGAFSHRPALATGRWLSPQVVGRRRGTLSQTRGGDRKNGHSKPSLYWGSSCVDGSSVPAAQLSQHTDEQTNALGACSSWSPGAGTKPRLEPGSPDPF